MPLPFDRYIEIAELEKRFNRDVADLLSEAIDAARTSLTDSFCPDGAFDVDAAGEVIASVNAERAIDRGLESICNLQTEFQRKGKR